MTSMMTLSRQSSFYLQTVDEELSQHYNKIHGRVLKSSLDTLTSWASVEVKYQCRPLAR